MPKNQVKPRVTRVTSAATGKRRGRATAAKKPAAPGLATKLDRLVAALKRPKGVSIPDMMQVTGWQAHSVRGALAGALKKRGHMINSTKIGGVRVYRIVGRT